MDIGSQELADSCTVRLCDVSLILRENDNGGELWIW